jgi:hypothetical protein
VPQGLHHVLEWSIKQPLWQRDALRRLACTHHLTSADLDDLFALCKMPDVGSAGLPVARPLAPEHIPSIGTPVAVRLAAIAEVNSVNALASGQRLVIPDIGLVSVYGENGAGKSGYVRILKRACRAQGADFPVLSNAYRP